MSFHCPHGASSGQAQFCWADAPASQNIPSQRTPFTLITWNKLFISDTTYFEVSPARPQAIRILKAGLYRLSASVREIYNPAHPTVAGPRQLLPHLTPAPAGVIDRTFGADPSTNAVINEEYAADHTWTGVPIAAGNTPFNDPFEFAQWEPRYVGWFELPATGPTVPLDIQWKYRQLSGNTQQLISPSRASVIFIPSAADTASGTFPTVQTF